MVGGGGKKNLFQEIYLAYSTFRTITEGWGASKREKGGNHQFHTNLRVQGKREERGKNSKTNFQTYSPFMQLEKGKSRGEKLKEEK